MKKMKVFLASLMSLFIFTGCEEKKPNICTTVYPVQYLAQRIGDKYVDVNNISQNELIQRAQIRSNYQATLKDADTLFYINGLEPYMEMYVDKIRAMDVEMVNLATKSAIYKFERYTSVSVDDKTTGLASVYYGGEEFSNIDKYNADPMLWMDPVAMTSMASDLRDYLIDKYPQYEKIFNTNYDELELDLARLDADFQVLPNEMMDISFVSMTPSFGIWQRSYGVKVYPVSLSKYGALPTSDQLNAIKKRIIRDKVRYIAIEQNLPQDMQDLQNTLIEELGLIPVTLHNLSSYSKDDLDAGKDYLTIMYENLKALQSIAG